MLTFKGWALNNKMIIKEITVGRKFNLGNYESLELRVTAEPDVEELTQELLDELASKLNEQIKIAVGDLK